MKMGKKIGIGISVLTITASLIGFFMVTEWSDPVDATWNEFDIDGDGRPDEFERENGLAWEPEDPESNDTEWTFLCYVCADDVPSGDPTGTLLPEMWEFIEKLSWVGCTNNINIVVQFDGSDVLNGVHPDQEWANITNNFNNQIVPTPTSTRRFLVGQDLAKHWDPYNWTSTPSQMTFDVLSKLWDVTDWPPGDPRNHGEGNLTPNWEANMADPHTLFEFVDWGMDTFPSDHYCLYIMSHGLGVGGFGYDYRPDTNATTSNLDVITLPEMNVLSTLFETNQTTIDLVNLYSCFMGNIEFGFKFLEFSDYYLASENWMMASGNQDDDTLSSLDTNPDWTPDRLAQEFIDDLEYWVTDGISNPPFNVLDWTYQVGNTSMTYSVLNASLMTTSLINDIITFNQNLDNGLNSNQASWYNTSMFFAINSAADRYPDDTTFPRLQIDYYYFLDYWSSSSGPPQPDSFFPLLNAAATSIMNVLWNGNPQNRMITYEKHDITKLNKTQGIAIYMPDVSPDFSIQNQNTPMDWLYWWHLIETCIRLGLIPGPP
jgi:hypothetical protein